HGRAFRTLLTCLLTTAMFVSRAFGQGGIADRASPEAVVGINPGSQLDSLVARALANNPELQAARARAAAARSRVGPAGLWSDPMLMVGLLNVPISPPSFTSDDMTRKMIGLLQSVPYPGKLRTRRDVAERESAVAIAALQSAQLRVARKVKEGYYEIIFLDRSVDIVRRSATNMSDLARVTEASYAVGRGEQADVLKARMEAAAVGASASALLERRRSALADLNRLLALPPESELGQPGIPTAITAAAVEPNAARIHFVASTLGARAAGSSLLPLDQLQASAVVRNPELRLRDAHIAAQAARVRLARKEYSPDFDVTLQYGQRSGRAEGTMGGERGEPRSDMISAQVSFPLRLRRRAVQGKYVAEAQSELTAVAAERSAQADEVRAEVAALYNDAERARTQLAIYVKAVLPQGRGALASAIGSYRTGKSGLLEVLDSQSTLLTYETEYHRALADFAKAVSGLEQVTGTEVLR
ncbi:MAG TPA: TolC family protein, partial [Gemmatimonadaceae bacterium]|nr:TolC family protein [Gemmatimonadaceae bacterium]